MRKRNPTMPRLVLVPVGRREDVLDRLGAASGQLVAVDDALGRALAPELEATALATIVSGIVAVSAPEARAIARSKPATF